MKIKSPDPVDGLREKYAFKRSCIGMRVSLVERKGVDWSNRLDWELPFLRAWVKPDLTLEP